MYADVPVELEETLAAVELAWPDDPLLLPPVWLLLLLLLPLLPCPPVDDKPVLDKVEDNVDECAEENDDEDEDKVFGRGPVEEEDEGEEEEDAVELLLLLLLLLPVDDEEEEEELDPVKVSHCCPVYEELHMHESLKQMPWLLQSEPTEPQTMCCVHPAPVCIESHTQVPLAGASEKRESQNSLQRSPIQSVLHTQ